MEKVARYLIGPPLSLERMNFSDGDDQVVQRRKGREGRPGEEERIDPLEFLSRVLGHIPPPWMHLIRFFGHDSNVSRGRRRKGREEPLKPGQPKDRDEDGLTDAQRRARRREWARLIRRVYEVDPLVCTRCGGEVRIVSVILEFKVIVKILVHLARKGITPGRGPPEGSHHPEPNQFDEA